MSCLLPSHLAVPLGPAHEPHSFCSAHPSPPCACKNYNTVLVSLSSSLSSFNFLLFMVHLTSTHFCLSKYIIQLKWSLSGVWPFCIFFLWLVICSSPFHVDSFTLYMEKVMSWLTGNQNIKYWMAKQVKDTWVFQLPKLLHLRLIMREAKEGRERVTAWRGDAFKCCRFLLWSKH